MLTTSFDSGAGAYSQGTACPSPRPQSAGARSPDQGRSALDSVVTRPSYGRFRFDRSRSEREQPCCELRVAGERRVRRGLDAELDADVVRAPIEVRLDARDDGIDIAPGHDRVDQPVAAVIGDVVVGPAETAEVVRVVREGEGVAGGGEPERAGRRR